MSCDVMIFRAHAIARVGFASLQQETNNLGLQQQLFHQMGHDGVPLDEVSNLMSQISHLKGRRQHAQKKPSQTHVLVSDVNVRM